MRLRAHYCPYNVQMIGVTYRPGPTNNLSTSLMNAMTPSYLRPTFQQVPTYILLADLFASLIKHCQVVMQLNSRLRASLLLLPLVIAAPAKRQNSPTNTLLSFVTELYPVNVLVTDVTDLITEADVAFGALAGYQTTENDVVQGKCADIVIVFARGTTETGNVGSLVGPPFFEAVKQQLGGKTLALQGVNNYPATVTDYLQGGSVSGSANM